MKPPGIYQLIEEALLMSESPLTCDDLFDRAEIKALAPKRAARLPRQYGRAERHHRS